MHLVINTLEIVSVLPDSVVRIVPNQSVGPLLRGPTEVFEKINTAPVRMDGVVSTAMYARGMMSAML